MERILTRKQNKNKHTQKKFSIIFPLHFGLFCLMICIKQTHRGICSVMFTGRLTRYLQTKTLTNTARRTLPTSLKILKGSSSSESDPASWAGFSLASWLRSFMASSKRDKYWWKPRRGELLRSSDGARSPLALCLKPPSSSSSDAPRVSLLSGRGEPLLSGVEVRLPWPEASGRKGDGLWEEDDMDQGSVLSRSRWKRGSAGCWEAPAERKVSDVTSNSIMPLIIYFWFKY